MSANPPRPNHGTHGAGVARHTAWFAPADPTPRPRADTPQELKAAQDGPCAGCRHFDRCTTEVIACEAFALFARLGGDNFSAERWRQAARQPSAAILQRILTTRRPTEAERRPQRESLAVRMRRESAEL
jgi:hypothetical protein